MIPSRKDVSSLFVQKSSKWMSENTQTLNGRAEDAPASPPKGAPNAAPAAAAAIPETNKPSPVDLQRLHLHHLIHFDE